MTRYIGLRKMITKGGGVVEFDEITQGDQWRQKVSGRARSGSGSM